MKPSKRVQKLKNLVEETAKLRKELEDKDWASKKTNEGIKILYKELEEKNKKLKELDQLKSQFVSNVSHEFKTPLAIAKECINLVLEKHFGEVTSKQKDTLEKGKNTIERLLRLVTDLLDLARIESGKMSMKREEISMGRLLEDVLATYETELVKRSITIDKRVSAGAGTIWADADKITEVMINLLSNAIKYTPDNGMIKINLTGDHGQISFEIEDSGPGIPKKDQARIFDKFERIQAEKQEGTGLGLPIAKDIIGLHKGKLWVESKPGKGSKFSFVLPRDVRMSFPRKRESKQRGKA